MFGGPITDRKANQPAGYPTQHGPLGACEIRARSRWPSIPLGRASDTVSAVTTSADVTAGLNAEQRRAVATVRGPVVILAGAGSGKTTTITRRIANQVLSGAFASTEILAVTFTKRAAEEMKARLAALGVPGVPASTFHSAAQRQIIYFADERRQVVPNKYAFVNSLIDSLPAEHRKVTAGDLVSEIEWARNSRITPENYLSRVAGHETPLPAELMADVFRGYEQAKRDAQVIDYEDQLELAVRVFESDDAAVERFRDRYRAFTVDEFQDVNLLQWTLLAAWLGDRDDLCAVGDDYQSIYGFTGATSTYLLSLPARFPNAAVVTLEQNYRSTHEVVSFANRLTPRLGGRTKTLRAASPNGPAPSIRVFADYAQEAAAIAGRCVDLQDAGTSLSEIAILYRANYRSRRSRRRCSLSACRSSSTAGRFLSRRAAKSCSHACARTRPRRRSQ